MTVALESSGTGGAGGSAQRTVAFATIALGMLLA
ncbi:MAG: hypothetical protein QOI50_1345, partial [Pseudonocardiales bacterium]|nr:hypothetical protein [Pseudonocardiales bacterium]